MNQENIGKLIKEIRKKNGLTQQEFANRYKVTYQAVSKWENGKNIPDISILKQICNDYNIDMNSLLEIKKNKINKTLVILISVVCLLVLSLIVMFNYKSDDFSFKALSTTCDDFNLFGSIAYNNSKTSIYISNITYCGENNNATYKKINCTLYEDQKDIKTKIDSFSYNGEITLKQFLKKVSFNVEHFSKSCKMYLENSLYLEIEAKTIDNKDVFYKIPLTLDDCN